MLSGYFPLGLRICFEWGKHFFGEGAARRMGQIDVHSSMLG